ncbi:MAG: class I SAM-dependent methyltransferase [Terriglobales bacterium]
MRAVERSQHNWLAYKINNEVVLRHLHMFTGRVVDLGCGTAPYKPEILSAAREYIGVDWNNSLHGQQNVDVKCDICGPLPFADEFADTVVSLQVMEHLPEPRLFLSECARILKSGGLLFLTVPFQWHIHEAPYDFYRYTRYGLVHLLHEAGFEQIEILENTGFWQMWLLKFNYHTLRYARGLLKLLWVPIWWINQTIAPVLDRVSKSPEEAASYTALARKP